MRKMILAAAIAAVVPMLLAQAQQNPPAPAGDVGALGGLAPGGSCPPWRCCATSAGTSAVATIAAAKSIFFIVTSFPAQRQDRRPAIPRTRVCRPRA